MTTTQPMAAAAVTSLASSRSILPASGHIIVVLGMHRSGTSMTTRALQALHVPLGDNLHPAAIDNPSGFWEDRDCQRINENLLRHLGSAYDHLAPAWQISRTDPIIGELSIMAAETLKAKLLKTDGVWAFKDPRTCRLMEFWQPVMTAAGYTTSFVVPVRNPISVVRSLERREQMPAEKGYLLWLQHVVPAVLLSARSSRRIVVDYDLTMDRPLAQLRRMADALGLPMDPTDPAVTSFARDFLDESLRHTRFSLAELRLDARAPRQVADTYEILLDLANDDDRTDIASPDVLRHFTATAEFLSDMAPAYALVRRFETEARSFGKALADQEEKAAGVEQQAVEQRNRAEAAEWHASEQQQRAEAAEQRAIEQQQRAEAAERRAIEQQGRLDEVEEIFRVQRIIAQDGSRQVQEARNRLAAIESSTSWRALYPVQRALRGHPRVARWTRRGARLVWWSVTLQLPQRLGDYFKRRQRATHGVPSTSPAATFDPNRTANRGSGSERHAFEAVAEQISRRFGTGGSFTPQIRDELIESSLYRNDSLSADAIERLFPLFVPEWHSHTGKPLESFLVYQRDGLAAGTPPGPLFDPAIYRQRAEAAGLPPVGAAENAVIHWLLYGYDARIVPTDRFDEAFYQMANPDIRAAPVWGFSHFASYGMFEGRKPTASPIFSFATISPPNATPRMPYLLRRWFREDFPGRASPFAGEVPAVYEERLEEVIHSDQMERIFAEVRTIEPEVGEISTLTAAYLAPFHDRAGWMQAEARRRIPRSHYDSIICVPWIRTGGSDLVAGLLARALLRIRPDESVLLLRVDHPHFERANWIPAEADNVDISDLTTGLGAPEGENLLRSIFRGLTPRRIINVNSRLCWTTQRMFGRNLATTTHSYAYMFCWDLSPTGKRVGYPEEFFASTLDGMTAFLTDTAYLRDELVTIHNLSVADRDRIVPMCTPAQTKPRSPSIARLVLNANAPGSRRLVLWAGRLDRQKRFDLVRDIARRMPDVEFRCWGASLLDQPPDLSRLPANISMQGSFGSFDDLPLAEAGVWLFTSLWEGMPTTIIELAVRGVALVSSSVGGIPELVRPETGWPIPADADAGAYVAALRAALDSPEEAMRRAEALQHLVASRYTEEMYDATLDALLKAEGTL